MDALANASPGGQGSKIDFLLESMGHVAHGENRWVHYPSTSHEPVSHEQERESLLCSPGFILAWVRDGPGTFSK